MKMVKCILLFLIFAHCLTKSSAQTELYVRQGNDVFPLSDVNTSNLNIKSWEIRLYKNGASQTGNQYWAVLKGNSSAEVLQKLKNEQQFELRFNEFIGKGRVHDEVNTYFNPKGPIAVLLEHGEKQTEKTSAEKLQEQLEPYYERAKKMYDEYKRLKDEAEKVQHIAEFIDDADAKKKKIAENLEDQLTPKIENGDLFKAYVEELQTAFLNISRVRNIINTSANKNIEKVKNGLGEIDKHLNNASAHAKKLQTLLGKQPAVSQANKKQTKSDQFYIFLTTSVTAKTEGLYGMQMSEVEYFLISEPTLYQGDKTDVMLQQKEKFLSTTNAYLINRFGKDKAHLIKSVDNIDVHLSKPFSTKMLYSVSEGYNAIEGYKNSMKETLQGLAKFEFIQIK